MTDQLGFDMGLPEPEPEIVPAAVIDGNYRYELTRRWAQGPLLEWVMLNPSTADGTQDDPTIRRCIGFARDWGFNGIRVCNLFALRSTDPDYLLSTSVDPVGPLNSIYLREEHGPLTVCAWGTHSAVQRRQPSDSWAALSNRSALLCLGYNADGSPKHPLYVKSNAGARPWPKPKTTEY